MPRRSFDIYPAGLLDAYRFTSNIIALRFHSTRNTMLAYRPHSIICKMKKKTCRTLYGKSDLDLIFPPISLFYVPTLVTQKSDFARAESSKLDVLLKGTWLLSERSSRGWLPTHLCAHWLLFRFLPNYFEFMRLSTSTQIKEEKNVTTFFFFSLADFSGSWGQIVWQISVVWETSLGELILPRRSS